MRRRPPADRRFLTTLARGFHAVLAGEKRLLLAVSGGADSLALLHGAAELADKLGLQFAVATIDHGLRASAAAEAQKVRELAASLALPFFTRSLTLPLGAGLEARARVLREAALEALRIESGAELIATAHTASDQAETLLMRLCRGASLRGARGILSRKGTIVRPLLEATRADVEAYLAARGLQACEDAMNSDPQFFRVRVRREVLPKLSEAAGFSVEPALARFSSVAAEEEALLHDWATRALEAASSGEEALAATALKGLPPPIARRVLALFLERQGLRIDFALLEKALEAVQRGGRAPLAARAVLETAGGHVRVVSAHRQSAPAASLRWEGHSLDRQRHPSGWSFQLAGPGGKADATFSAAAPAFPFEVRTRRPGDRVRLPNGRSRKLQDVLIDARVPREVRDSVLLVVHGAEIYWVIGVTKPPVAEQADILLHAFAPL